MSAAPQGKYAEAAAETITETDEIEARSMMEHEGAPRRFRWASALAVSALLAVAAAAALAMSMGRELLGGADASDQAVGLQSEWAAKMDTGCGNWQDLAFGEAKEKVTLEQCKALCEVQPGCKQINYQADACGTSEGVAPGSCYLFGGDSFDSCIPETNTCWDLYDNPSPLPDGYKLQAAGTGCSNWEAIKLGDVKTVWSNEVCFKECQLTSGCTSFNFQKQDCQGNQQIGKGACYLFKDSCITEANSCWDLYSMTTAAVTTTADATTTGP